MRNALHIETAHPAPSEQGTSLIEAMFATLVCIILVNAVLTSVVQQSRHRQIIAERSLALAAVVNNLERARTLSDAEIAAIDGTGFDIPGANGQAGGLRAVAGDPDGLPGRFFVTEDQNVGGDRLFRVVAIAEWDGSTGNSRMTMQSLIGARR